MSPRPQFKLSTALALLLAIALPAGRAAGQAPPDEAWRTVSSEHFRVTFPARLETLARRAAARAEIAYEALSDAFLDPPDGTIDVLLTDHTDYSNGFAQVVPSDRIVVYARPPVDDLGLGYFDDWMELVITHELTHIVHLDRTGSALGRAMRAVFGRVPAGWPYFPGLDTPAWLTEGLAVWYESYLTDSGRLRGTYHEMELRTAALEGRFEDIGQASGQSPIWPGGARPYVYGSLFFEYLLDHYGEDRMGDFAEALAGQWIPYRLNSAGRKAFGISLSQAWREWSDSLAQRYRSLDDDLSRFGPVTEPERLTRGARYAIEPAVSPDGSTLAYVRNDGRSDPQLRLSAPGGQDRGELTRVNGFATFSWLPDGGVVVGQLDYADPYRAFSDLYTVSPTGASRRLTRGLRLSHPAPSPDGSWAVAVQDGGGTNALVRVDLATGAVSDLVPARADVYWAYPRVSPDGRWIASTRWTTGAHQDLVVLEAATGAVASEVTHDRALDVAPAWSPDGSTLVWVSDRTGILNVYATPFDTSTGRTGEPRMLTNVRTGVTEPSVDASGRWLYFSGYHVDGWEVERVPFDPRGLGAAPPPAARFTPGQEAAGGPPQVAPVAGPVRDYSAWRTLLPRYWEPVLREPVRASLGSAGSRELLGFGVGAQTAGWDLVGRHAFGAFGRAFTSGGKFEGGLVYSFAGLGNPVLGLSATQFWDDDGARIARLDPAAPYDTLFVLERERAVSGSATFVRRRWRSSVQLGIRAGIDWQDRELLDDALQPSALYRLNRPDTRVSDVQLSLSYSTVRSHAFQLGGSRGFRVSVAGRMRDELALPDSLAGVPGSDRSVDDVIGRVRAYVPLWHGGYETHVLALQVTGGAGFGPDADRGYFEVGGASGQAETLAGISIVSGSSVLFPVRGYPGSRRFGRLAWSASAEYRFPLWIAHRGLGAWPLYFGRFAGSLFADAGNAWGPDLSPDGFVNGRRGALASVGVELLTEVVGLFDHAGLVIRSGFAVPLVEGDASTVYLRLGLPF